MKKVLVLAISLLLIGVTLIPVNAGDYSLNSSNTIIVLPTTKIVNGTPLHIGEDAITGARLGSFLVLKGISQNTYTRSVSVPVEYHSVPIFDDDGIYVLSSRDMPDVGINVSDSPVGNAVVVRVNFSRVYYNETLGEVEFLDRSVEIIFNENTTPLGSGDNVKIVTSSVDGVDVIYFYSVRETEEASASLQDTLSIGRWVIKFLDFNADDGKMLVNLRYPSGILKQKVMEIGNYYLMYLDDNDNEDFEVFENYPSSRIQELLEDGVKYLVVFRPTSFFVGLGGTRSVIFDYTIYSKSEEYRDGDVYRGQWVWDVDPYNKLFTLYLHVEPEDNFDRVTVGQGGKLELPTDWGLAIEPLFEDDESSVNWYRFVRSTYVTENITLTMPVIEVTDDVYSFIVNDTELEELPTDRNVIIVGGWISNAAWRILETTYGPELIGSIKEEILTKGYVVKVLENPANPEYKVIILAGKTYRETAKAVEEFMESLD